MRDIEGMLQALACHRLRLVNLEVLRQGTTAVIHLALQIRLIARGQTHLSNVFVVPVHGQIVGKAGGIGTRFDGKIVRAVIDVDAVTIA